jgi:hypothetical protein
MADHAAATGSGMEDLLDCQTAFAKEVQVFELLVSLSIGFALISFLASAWCCHAKLLAHPRRAGQIYGLAAIFKISQGVLLLTVFAPWCPSGCTCPKYHLSYVYPFIVILLGNVLAYRSKQFYDTAQQQPASPPGGSTSSSTTSTTKKESELV